MKSKYSYFSGILLLFLGIYMITYFLSIQEILWSKLFGLLLGIIVISSGIGLFYHKNEKYGIALSRIFVGLVFTYSGFVKAVDPLGSKYKFIDYFEAWQIDFFSSSALILGILLSTIEFVIGIGLLCKLYTKQFSFLSLVFMILFTPITFYLAMQQNITGKELVHDCGCFGDALILTNWQTFVKNLFLLIPIIILNLFIKNKENPLSRKTTIGIISCFTLGIILLSVYSLEHLPPIDFRPYKKGTKLVCRKCSDIQQDNTIKVYQYADFKNVKTGEHKEFEITENYPDYTIWEYNSNIPIREEKTEPQTTENDNKSEHIFELNEMFFTKEGEDYTCKIINDTNYLFLLVQYNLETSNNSYQEKINELYDWANKKNIAMYSATSSLNETIDEYKKETKAKYPFVNSDDISLKTIVRANPGLVLLKKGVIINKWHYKDIPSIKEFEIIINNH